MSTQVGIRYVGKKTRPQPDTVAGTSLVWVDTEQVHFVSEAIAARLLKYTDVWAEAGRKEAADSLADLGIESPKTPDAIAETEPAPLVRLDSMDKASMIQFAQRQFGQKLIPQQSEGTMRTKIQNWMNDPMVAGLGR